MADCYTDKLESCGCAPPWCVPFPDWHDFVKTIPKMYWGADSQEQRLHTICAQLHKVICYAGYLGVKVNITHEQVLNLQEEFEKFKESGFIDYYEALLKAWIDENMPWIIEQSIKMVFFGLTSDGYFCAYIPESWSDITFDTGAVYGQSDYGRLILRYEVDGSGVIDNTGRYDELNANLLKVMGTLYAPMREGGDI